MNVDNTKDITVLSLCSGYGGIELGLKRACPNVRTVAYVEVEAFACANLVAKMEQGLLDVAPVWTDIKTFDGQPFCGKVHIITAGYPCQPFSVAGKRKGTDDPRHLWPYIERIIEAVRPVWFFGENVSGHLTIGFPEVYRSLRNLGYAVEAGIFSAAECGAPHRRERLFILGKRKDALWQYLADTKSSRGRRGIGNNQSQREKVRGKCNLELDGGSRKRSQLADTCLQGLQRTKWGRIQRTTSQGQAINHPRYDKWPARPGQPQYEWEEPRVVDDTKFRNKRSVKQHKRQDKGKINKHRGTITSRNETEGQAQSQLGRAVDGTSYRVDRLRLLGNGVVPQQAEKAFKYLIRKF